MPPPRPNPYKPAGDFFEELTSDSPLDDTIDGHVVARVWYGYAQEPLPGADVLPGSNKPITDRVHQRRPKHMTTLLFRNYPGLAQSAAAERLAQEGWFAPDREEEEKARAESRDAEESWEFPEDSWFKDRNNKFADGKPARLKLEKDEHADRVWERAYRIWVALGEANHLEFRSDREAAEMYEDARKYCQEYGIAVGTQLPPPPGGVESLKGDEKRYFEAARYMFEYKFYRDLSNFAHHYYRAKVESEKATIAARKLFYQAETAYLKGNLREAREIYERPAAIDAWRDDVLLGGERDPKTHTLHPRQGVKPIVHRVFREDMSAQEYAYETQLRYLQFFNEQFGVQIKKGVARTWGFMTIAACPPPGAGLMGYWTGLFVPVKIEEDWTPPPIGSYYAGLKGKFDISVFDVDEKEQHLLAAALLASTGDTLAATATATAWSKPLISDQTRQVVRERKGLNPPRKPPEAEAAEAKKD
jgi:hypothetical protein